MPLYDAGRLDRSRCSGGSHPGVVRIQLGVRYHMRMPGFRLHPSVTSTRPRWSLLSPKWDRYTRSLAEQVIRARRVLCVCNRRLAVAQIPDEVPDVLTCDRCNKEWPIGRADLERRWPTAPDDRVIRLTASG